MGYFYPHHFLHSQIEMPSVSSSAPGKIILFGEHAVVYGQPAIAIPVHQKKAVVYILAAPTAPTGQVRILAPDIGLESELHDLPETHPFFCTFMIIQKYLDIDHFPAMKIKIKSDIPIASGLGSGTAVSVSMIRAIMQFLGKAPSNAEVSSLAFEVEKLYHGFPSGVDNSVIAYAQPIFFIRQRVVETLAVAEPLQFLVAHTGVTSKTVDVVEAVRSARDNSPAHYDSLFSEIGAVCLEAKKCLATGQVSTLGHLMNQNQELLSQLEVSCPELDRLIAAAKQAGATGVKLSGAGRGGYIIALVSPDNSEQIAKTLIAAGARDVFRTDLPSFSTAEEI